MSQNIRRSILTRIRIIFVCISLVSLAIVYRIFHLQYIEGEKWREIAKQNQMEFRTIPAPRGSIYADNGSLLATSLPFYQVAIDPTVANKEVFDAGIDSLSVLLAANFKDRSAEDWKRKLQDFRKQKRRYIRLSNELQSYQVIKMMSKWPILREGRMKGGLVYEEVEKRFMPFGMLAKRTIGSIAEEKFGIAGIEFSFNKELAGKDGQAVYRKTQGNNWIPLNDGTQIAPEEGLDIYTTIDINLQDVAETALRKALEMHQADNGCVILMEVSTGEIKAIANLGKDENGNYVEDYNYAVARRIEPGSTFKLASYLALLEEKKLPDSIETGNGEYKFFNANIMRDSKPGGYGKISVQQAFELSSNIAVAKLITEHFATKPQKFIDYLDKFGLTKPINFQLKGAAPPYVRVPGDPKWSGLSLPWLSIGYESAFSPLHILTFYNGIANNGTVVEPIIVKAAKSANKVVHEYKSRVIAENICSENTLKTIRKWLVGVVNNGTARNIRNANYAIAGKTGTAQKIKDGKYIKSYYTSFAGFFPADKPKYSCIVAIDNPQGFQQYGSDVAAPVFKELADKIHARDIDLHEPIEVIAQKEEGIFPLIQSGNFFDLSYLCNTLGISNHATSKTDEWVRANPVNNAIMWRSIEPRSNYMPDVRGMTLKDALYVLENQGLVVKHTGFGRVKEQTPTANTKINKGMTVVISLDY